MPSLPTPLTQKITSSSPETVLAQYIPIHICDPPKLIKANVPKNLNLIQISPDQIQNYHCMLTDKPCINKFLI